MSYYPSLESFVLLLRRAQSVSDRLRVLDTIGPSFFSQFPSVKRISSGLLRALLDLANASIDLSDVSTISPEMDVLDAHVPLLAARAVPALRGQWRRRELLGRLEVGSQLSEAGEKTFTKHSYFIVLGNQMHGCR